MLNDAETWADPQDHITKLRKIATPFLGVGAVSLIIGIGCLITRRPPVIWATVAVFIGGGGLTVLIGAVGWRLRATRLELLVAQYPEWQLLTARSINGGQLRRSLAGVRKRQLFINFRDEPNDQTFRVELPKVRNRLARERASAREVRVYGPLRERNEILITTDRDVIVPRSRLRLVERS